MSNEKELLGTSNLGNDGKAYLVLNKQLNPGVYIVSGTYQENDEYEESIGDAELEVLKIGTSVNLSTDKNSYYYSENVVLTINIVDDDGNNVSTGYVTVYDDSTVVQQNYMITGNQTAISFAPSTVGSHSLRVVYSGDNTYNTSQNTVDITVIKLTVALTAVGHGYVYSNALCGRQFIATDNLGNNVTIGTLICKVNGSNLKGSDNQVVQGVYDVDKGCYDFPSVEKTFTNRTWTISYTLTLSNQQYERPTYTESLTPTELIVPTNISPTDSITEDGYFGFIGDITADNLCDIILADGEFGYCHDGDFLDHYAISFMDGDTEYLVANPNYILPNNGMTIQEYTENGTGILLTDYAISITADGEIIIEIMNENINADDPITSITIYGSNVITGL